MIVAEIGLNHLGKYSIAEEYVNKLLNTETDGISFQIREKEYYSSPEKKHLTLNEESYLKLSKKIKSKNKKFGIAIADIDKIDFFESIGTDFYKVIRNDIINKDLIRKLISTGKKLIISTGLSSEKEIENFLNEFDNSNIVLNHTQLSYDIKDCNLSALHKMKSRYNVKVSYGSHCSNHNVLYMSLCYNPSDILFYIKGNDNKKYPDDKHAIKLNDIEEIIYNLKNLKQATGTGIKQKMEIKIK